MGQNQGMDVPELLEAASLLVPEKIATENDITVNDVRDYLPAPTAHAAVRGASSSSHALLGLAIPVRCRVSVR